MKKRNYIIFLLLITMFILFASGKADAADDVLFLDINKGNIVISDQVNSMIVIEGDGTETTNNIVIDIKQSQFSTKTIAISNVNIKTTDKSPLIIKGDSIIYLSFEGTNTFTGGFGYAGINIPYDPAFTNGANIQIKGEGTVFATGGIGAAGIGGNMDQESTNISCSGPRFIAKGGDSFSGNSPIDSKHIDVAAGAGIGTGGTVNGDSIAEKNKGFIFEIDNGTVNSTGGKGTKVGDMLLYPGAGIGSGGAVKKTGEVRSNTIAGTRMNIFSYAGGSLIARAGEEIPGVDNNVANIGTGGSTNDAINSTGRNNYSSDVHEELLSVKEKNEKIFIQSDFSVFGTNNIYSDSEGRVGLYFSTNDDYNAVGVAKNNTYPFKVIKGVINIQTLTQLDNNLINLSTEKKIMINSESIVYNNAAYKFVENNPVEISGRITEGEISIVSDQNITLNNFYMQSGYDVSYGVIAIVNSSNVTLHTKGTNTINDRSNFNSSITVGGKSTLTIEGEPSSTLSVIKENGDAAVIGAFRAEKMGNVIINSGTINLSCSASKEDYPLIGADSPEQFGRVIINGGNLNLTSKFNYAIGTTKDSDVPIVEINGGSVVTNKPFSASVVNKNNEKLQSVKFNAVGLTGQAGPLKIEKAMMDFNYNVDNITINNQSFTFYLPSKTYDIVLKVGNQYLMKEKLIVESTPLEISIGSESEAEYSNFKKYNDFLTKYNDILLKDNTVLVKEDLSIVESGREDYNILPKEYQIKLTSQISNLNQKYNILNTEYTVTFVIDKQTTTVKVKYDNDAVAPQNPYKPGFNFVKWDRDFTHIKDEITVTAVFESAGVVVTLHPNGGTVTNTKLYVIKNTSIKSIPIPYKDGYIFVGWYSDYNLNNVFINNDIVRDHMSLYAKWNMKKAFLTLNTGLGEDVVYPNIALGSNLENELKGYTFNQDVVFLGWFKDKEKTKKWDIYQDKIIEDTILYAKYEVKLFDITGILYDKTEEKNIITDGTIVIQINEFTTKYSMSNSKGEYTIIGCPNGIYNMSITVGEKTVTESIEVNNSNINKDIIFPRETVSLKVSNTNASSISVVDGMKYLTDKNSNFFTEAEKQLINSGKEVKVDLFITNKTKKDLSEYKFSDNHKFINIFDITIMKSNKEVSETKDTLVFTVLLGKYQKEEDIVVSRIHNGKISTLTQDSNNQEYFEITDDGKYLKLHVNQFSLYMVGEQPYIYQAPSWMTYVIIGVFSLFLVLIVTMFMISKFNISTYMLVFFIYFIMLSALYLLSTDRIQKVMVAVGLLIGFTLLFTWKEFFTQKRGIKNE